MKELKLQPKFQINKKGLFLALLLLVVVFSVFAEDLPLVGTIDKVVEFIQGKLVLSICVLAIVISGIAMIFTKGQGSKIAFATILGGVAIVQGATAIAKLIITTN